MQNFFVKQKPRKNKKFPIQFFHVVFYEVHDSVLTNFQKIFQPAEKQKKCRTRNRKSYLSYAVSPHTLRLPPTNMLLRHLIRHRNYDLLCLR